MPARRPVPTAHDHDAGVVIPLRSFTLGNTRLADALDDDARGALARAMARRVVAAALPRPIVVVSSAPEVVAWATANNLASIADPGSLDAAADAGRAWMRARHVARVVVAHGDLPLVTTFDAVTGDGAAPVAVIVPDRDDDGTPVLSLPVDAPFAFGYGPGSFARHTEEAARCALRVRVERVPELRFDVDVPDDLDLIDDLAAFTAGPQHVT
jgi:2-phospho-L-lactate guanylyltransferase